MALTVEEKKKRKEERDAEKSRLALKYPGAQFDYRNVQICAEEGDRWFFVRTNSYSSQFKREEFGGKPSEWYKADMYPWNIEAFAGLVKALTARLNVMIEEANAEITGIQPVKPLKDIPS